MHDLCGRAGRHVKIRPRNEKRTHIIYELHNIYNIHIYLGDSPTMLTPFFFDNAVIQNLDFKISIFWYLKHF